MNEKFTKGPLEAVFPEGSNGFWRVAGGFDEVCTCYGENAQHEAHLFAAAPDMYEMLQGLYENACSIGDDSEWVDEIKEVLAKARGEL